MGVDRLAVEVLNTHPSGSTPAAACSVRCQIRHALSTLTVVASRSMARLEFAVLPRDSCSL